MQLCCGFPVRMRGLADVLESTKKYLFAVASDPRLPCGAGHIPGDSLVPAPVVFGQTDVVGILCGRRWTKVGPEIVESVTIEMVDASPLDIDTHAAGYFNMKKNGLQVRARPRPPRIPRATIASSGGRPIHERQITILLADNC